MTRDEYEAGKRRLAAERQAAVALIDSAHAAQLRALELVWMARGDGEIDRSALPPPPAAAASLEVPRPSAPQPPPPAPAAPAPSARVRQAPGQLWSDVQEALPSLPVEFDTADLRRALGYAPHRGSLHRVLWELLNSGALEIAQRGEGRQASRFRQRPFGSPPPEPPPLGALSAPEPEASLPDPGDAA